MAYGSINADTLVTSTSGGILGAGNASIMKNRIINGAMVIDQRNAGASVTLSATTGQYTLDRFYFNASQASKLTVQQSTTTTTGFYNSLVVTVASAATIGAGDYFTMNQLIEANNTSDFAFGTANAKIVTLSFWVRSSITGTFVCALLNSALNRSYLATYTISAANTWEQKSITIAGDTTGTWVAGGNGVGVAVRFDFGSGSGGMGTANTWQTGNLWSVSGSASSTFAAQSGATFYITGVQLEVGSSATGFEYVNYQTSLANCQRYYEKSYSTDVVPATSTFTGAVHYQWATSTNSMGASWTFKVEKRTAPTVTVWDATGGGTPTAGTVYKGGYGKAVANNTPSTSQGYISTTDSTSAAEFAFQWVASAEL